MLLWSLSKQGATGFVSVILKQYVNFSTQFAKLFL